MILLTPIMGLAARECSRDPTQERCVALVNTLDNVWLWSTGIFLVAAVLAVVILVIAPRP